MPGGVLHQPSRRSLDELKLRAPDFPVREFERAIGTYKIEREHVEQPSRDVRDELDEIASLSAKLYSLLSAKSDEMEGYLGVECVKFGRPMLPETMMKDLLHLQGLALNAKTEAAKNVSKGRGASPTTRLICELAAALDSAGLEATSKANGPLRIAFDIAMEELNLSFADTGDTVRKALNSPLRKQRLR